MTANDLVAVLWILGVVSSAQVLYLGFAQMKKYPRLTYDSTYLVAVAAFSVFPVLGVFVSAYGWYRVITAEPR